jgi:hypothetical protein
MPEPRIDPSPKRSSRPKAAQEPAEARARPRPREPVRPAAKRGRGRSFLRSTFNIAFALVWAALGAAAGYFSYPGETWEPLIGSSAGAVAGLLASALMLRWISGRP